MRNNIKPAKNWLCLIVLFVLHSSFLILGVPAPAQVAGNNVVYDSNGHTQPSTAFIDASKVSQGSDICATIHNIILSGQSFVSGTVIDARGIISANPMVCAASPWSGVSSPSTVLLPAGTIVIPNTWILPSNTKLIGLGYGTTGGTVIQACTTSNCSANFPTGTAMIQLGIGSCSPGVFCDSGISVENLMLDGFSLNINGIQNSTAQSSYVDQVTIYRILGTGLVVSSQNSGPYTNITFDSGPSALSTTTCASVSGVKATRGIHGLTCIAGSVANTAVYLDASSTSIEDARIAGFYDGILVGSQGAAQGDVLFNIFGDTIVSTDIPAPVNVIHLSALHTVTDISIMGVNNVVGSNNTIRDDLTSTTLTDPYVAMYVLGRSANGGYSRFTTSPHAATWGAGASTPSGGCSASSAGSLYSNTSGTGAALWVCPVGSTAWVSIR
jgi:hypothetical protein